MDPKGAGSELQESRHRGRARAVPAILRRAVALLPAISVFGQPTVPVAAAPARPSFAADVAPILGRFCLPCHGAREPKAGLQVDRYLTLMRGGDHGPPVVLGRPDQSLLVAKIERRDRPAMPPRRRLPAAAVATLRAWIAAGAPP